MEDFVGLAMGLLMPLIISYLKQRQWSAFAKVLLSLSLSIAVALLINAIRGTLDFTNLLASTGIVFTTATVVYKTYFQETQINHWLEQQTFRHERMER